jgi:hypothetical protein
VTVHVLPPWTPSELPSFDVTTHGSNSWRGLSPMLLGPVMLYDGHWSATMENAWQYAKVYPGYDNGSYWPWAQAGWANPRGVRYPMGKGAVPLYSAWAGERLGYTQARRRIYAPLYAQAVRFYSRHLLTALKHQAAAGDLVIRDFDAYDHRALGYSWGDVIADPDRKMGHGFVLAMMLDSYL